MTILSESNRVNYFKELSFYNEPIKKPEIKRLKIMIYYLNYFFLSNRA